MAGCWIDRIRLGLCGKNCGRTFVTADDLAPLIFINTVEHLGMFDPHAEAA